MGKITKIKNSVKNYNYSSLSPIKRNKTGKVEVCGNPPGVCLNMTLIIFALWGIFVGLFFAFLHAFYSKAENLRHLDE
ncbi:hypothetical protein DLAC_07079 [Tieghemostelium lacteum]|uniref:Transmembrane protein n=1 Tax=Tieghemostelium lacteum TaxID=361077 RepID=A0A151ZE45_TIELA|nr:hypothetical protein DLAC_07079 [Tieghemostelium lacteum]|eukprot:KYQ92232.1 hypothetical protein DLAC_07079 [Tieghemostelium lacteum]